MNDETMNEEIKELEEAGWEADAAPRAVEKRFKFPDFTQTVNFLIALGKAVAAGSFAMPAVHIAGGTDVQVRVGGPPVRTISAQEIALAKALSVA